MSIVVEEGFLSAFAFCVPRWGFERLESLWELVGDASRLVVSFESIFTASTEFRDCDFSPFAGFLGTLATGRESSKRSLNDFPPAGGFTGESSTKELLASALPISPSSSSSLDKGSDFGNGKTA
jgi:hypothetical protein